jgi:hypothetical protein
VFYSPVNPGRFSRGLHEFDAWAANFGETRTELELQPSGLYKPVTRFTEFVNVADLMALYRDFADVVQQDDLRRYVNLPAVKGGHRQIVVAPVHARFRAYQKTLAERITAIENRTGRPQKGDDILLSVMGDARHAALDLRFVGWGRAGEGEDSKLDLMIRNVFSIWEESAQNRYTNPETGQPYALPGAVQMIFSDLGTVGAQGKRGFSAYLWIRDELVRMGVPREQIAFMQDYKKAEAKQRLFGDLNAGRKRILIGSTQTMGTGVNAQQRLLALHHLDVPWLVSDIIQREGRIERQGNQNPEIRIYAYAQEGSVDAGADRRLCAHAGCCARTTALRGQGGDRGGTVRYGTVDITVDQETKPLGLVARIENLVLRLDAELADTQKTRDEAARRLPVYQARLGVPFRDQALLDEKRNALADLAATSGAGEEAPANDDMPPSVEGGDAPEALRDAA